MFRQPNKLKILLGATLFGILSTTLHAKIEKKLSYAAALSDGDKVSFYGDLADIKLVKTDSNEVRYDIKLTYKSDNESKAEKMFDKIEWTFDDDGPTIELKEKIKKAKKLDIDVTVYLPDNHPIEIGTVSGDISTSDDFTTDVKLHVVSGDITAQSVNGNLTIDSVSGDLRARDITGNVYLNTVSGDASIQSVGGKLNSSSVSGDVEIGDVSSEISYNGVSGDFRVNLTEKNEGPVYGETVSGDITIHCASQTGLQLTADTISGDINCNLTLSNIHSSKHKLSGTFKDGKIKCKTSTVSGDIEIKN